MSLLFSFNIFSDSFYALVYVYFLIRKICRTALTATWSHSFSHLYPQNQVTGMSNFLRMTYWNIHNELTDFVFSVKLFIKLKAWYWLFFWCVSVVSHGCKFEHFFTFFPLPLFVIFTSLPAANSQLVAEEQRREHMLWKRGSFREFCYFLSPITSQINSFCLQWHLLVRAELISCGAGFIAAFKWSRCFFSLPPSYFQESRNYFGELI